jgi:GDP-L-fucose synthase
MGIDRSSRVFLAGHRGLVGSAIGRLLAAEGFTDVVTAPRTDLDLRDPDAVSKFFAEQRPDVVILAAAKVGGILANANAPTEHLSDNLRIQLNVLDTAHAFDVSRLLFLGSSCVYPKFAPQPISEDSLLTGLLEPTNDAYAIAKIAGILHVQALRRQYNRGYVSVMPTNLYGPGDNFDLETSHVLPGILHRMHLAKVAGAPSVELWGTGRARREFLHVDDAARACLYVLENYDAPEPVNIGTGSDLPIAELATVVADIVGYGGEIRWDTDKPDGTPSKRLDVSKLTGLGWRPTIDLRDGIEDLYRWARATGQLIAI